MWFFFFFSSRRRHTRYWRDWSSDVCSSDLGRLLARSGCAPYSPECVEEEFCELRLYGSPEAKCMRARLLSWKNPALILCSLSLAEFIWLCVLSYTERVLVESTKDRKSVV